MKGIELPINILVIVAIAVIVLLGLVALYFIGFNPMSTNIALDAAKNNACRDFLNQNPICSNTGLAMNYPAGTATTLQAFANANFGCAAQTDQAACVRRICGCPGA